MFTLAFWKGAAERAISTFAQSLLAVIGVTGIGFGDVDWALATSIAGLATLASLLKALVVPGFTAGAPETQGRHEATDDDLITDSVAGNFTATDAYPVAEPHEPTTSPERDYQ